MGSVHRYLLQANIQLFHHFQMNVGGVTRTNTTCSGPSQCLQLAIDWLHFRGQYQDAPTQISQVCVYGMPDYKVVKTLKAYVWFWENNVGV